MSEINMNKEFFEDLIKGTNFVTADTGSLMNSRSKVPTPLYVINCVYGGGIPLGLIGEISGPPSSGKSTFGYQCMGIYQKKFEDGIAVVYDMESSSDNDRLKVLGVDTQKLLRLPATTMEDAFASMFKMLNKLLELQKTNPNISTFQIYDTIAAGGTNKQKDAVSGGNSAFNAGSMMEAPRILKQNLSNLFPYLEKLPVFIGLLNQVFTQMGVYTSSVKAGGGYGLQHNIHFHIVFGKNKDVFDGDFLIGTESEVQLGKSKLSPKLIGIPCFIDARAGGKIDEVDSFVKYLAKSSVNIVRMGSWYNILDTIEKMKERYPSIKNSKGLDRYQKQFRKNDFYAAVKEDRDLCNFLQVALIDFIDGIYPMQSEVNNEYKLQIMNECSYFNNENEEKESIQKDIENKESEDNSENA